MSSAAAVQNPSELDDFLLALALEVAALEDAEASPETVLRGKGKGPASGLDDFLLAARLQALEEKQLLEDSKMARSIAGACVADSEVIEALIQQERAEERDRRLALAIGGGRESPIGARPSSRSSVTSVASSAPSFELPPFPVRAGQSSGSSTPASAGSSLYGECASCFSTKLVLALPCKDRYCAACIIGLVKTAAKDVTLIPARCCGKPFPESLIASVLRTDPTTLRDYEKMKAHKSEMIAASEKAVDEDTGASFERSGLKRCPGCRHFIEKVFGCNHMTWVRRRSALLA